MAAERIDYKAIKRYLRKCSAMQQRIMAGLYDERLPIGEVARAERTGVHRIQMEELAALRTIVIHSAKRRGGNGAGSEPVQNTAPSGAGPSQLEA